MALIYINFYISRKISNAEVRHRGQQSRTQEHRFDQSGHERGEGGVVGRARESKFVHSGSPPEPAAGTLQGSGPPKSGFNLVILGKRSSSQIGCIPVINERETRSRPVSVFRHRVKLTDRLQKAREALVWGGEGPCSTALGSACLKACVNDCTAACLIADLSACELQ